VVDSAFYHTFSPDTQLQKSYMQALHRATKPGARLFMFEFGTHNVNGLTWPRAIPEDDFRQTLPAGGWNITYLGPTTYQANISIEAFQIMAARNPELAENLEPLVEQLRIIEPLLIDGRVHAPFWEVHATRID
jgi:hypothetical protein